MFFGEKSFEDRRHAIMRSCQSMSKAGSNTHVRLIREVWFLVL